MNHHHLSTYLNNTSRNIGSRKLQCCGDSRALSTILYALLLSIVWFRHHHHQHQHQLQNSLVKQTNTDTYSPLILLAEASVVPIPRPEAIYGSSESGTSPVEDEMDDEDDPMGADSSETYGASDEPEDENGEYLVAST